MVKVSMSTPATRTPAASLRLGASASALLERSLISSSPAPALQLMPRASRPLPNSLRARHAAHAAAGQHHRLAPVPILTQRHPPTAAQKKEDKEKEKADEWSDPTKIDESALSEEDLALKQNMDMLVERVMEKGGATDVQLASLESLKTEIKTATSSMTSVPKPLKFLRPHWEDLTKFFVTMPEGANKPVLSLLLSCLAMTMAEEGSRDSLKYKLTGSDDPIGSWGHEYVRNLSGEVTQEYLSRGSPAAAECVDLMKLVDEIIPFNIEANAEPEACDLLMEVDRLTDILPFADDSNYVRIGLYLQNCASYLAEPDDTAVLQVACTMYRQVKQFPEAMRMALRLNEMDLITAIYEECDEGREGETPSLEKKQLALVLGRQQALVEEDDEDLQELQFNTRLSEQFLGLARDLEVLEPKTPEEIYKSNLDSRGSGSMDSARANLASTFVNAFVNAGYTKDKLMQVGEQEDGGEVQDNKWLFKNKDHGMMSAAASVGMLLLWDIEQGLNEIDRYLHDSNNYIQAGALLAMGIVHSGVRHDCDPAKALLTEYLESSNTAEVRLAAIAGLGMAYAGTAREDVMEDLMPNLVDEKSSGEIVAMSALSLSMVFVGHCREDLAGPLVEQLLKGAVDATLPPKDLKKAEEARDKLQQATLFRFTGLALGILFLGKKNEVAGVLKQLEPMEGPMAKYVKLTVETCAYAGSGDVDTVHKLMAICGEHPEPETEIDHSEEEKKEDKQKREEDRKKQNEIDYGHQFVATIGISLVSMAEDIGTEMSLRMMDHLMQYSELYVRRAVPIALGIQFVSNPDLTVTETLSKLSHDSDADVSMSAMLALGLVGAGTNNSRVAGMLRGLASYYAREPNHLFVLRIAQGFLHMGKGLIGFAPYHGERSLMSPVAVSGLLIFMHSCADIKNTMLGKWHWMLYFLAISMYPRMLVTVDADMQPVPCSVRVGMAVDTVGQAGKPKTITGFQTHTTPVRTSPHLPQT